MKKSYIKFIGLAAVTGSAFLFMSNRADFSTNKFHQVKLNTSAGPSAKTGAPGESSCTNCHSGSAQDGTTVNSLTLDGGGTNYSPGAINAMTLSLSDASNKNGFQLVALDENNEMAGSFTITDGANTQLTSNAQLSRDYVTHTATGTGQTSWTFDWDAPSDVADVTFYVATNKTNGSGSTSGDVIYLSSHVFGNPQASLESEDIKEAVVIGYSPSQHSVVIDFPVLASSDVSVNVIDLTGKSVYFNNEGAFEQGDFTEKVRLPETMENGIYVVTLFVGNKPYSQKIMVNR